MGNDDLSALIFELQRARSPRDKARALARAWRTVRGLNSVDRRLLAREVGFEGAEELVEGLAGKSGGVFAPAAVLEALGKMRRDEGMSIKGILSGLRDPGRRDDLLVRGIDLVSDSVDGLDEDHDEDAGISTTEEPVHPGIPIPIPPPAARVEAPDVGEHADELLEEPIFEGEGDSGSEEPEDHDAETIADPEPPPVETEAPRPVEEPSAWAAIRFDREPETPGQPTAKPATIVFEPTGTVDFAPAVASVRERLRAFKDGAASLSGARASEITEALDALPEPWARRRAVVALIEASDPDDVDELLDVIEAMDRPMDRRWCLSALATRGGLVGDDLKRALGMLGSPAAKRRVEAMASRR